MVQTQVRDTVFGIFVSDCVDDLLKLKFIFNFGETLLDVSLHSRFQLSLHEVESQLLFLEVF